jgi:hypothetical protein
MTKKRKTLNLREKKFVKAYVKGGGNGAKAAREAGYSDKGTNDASKANQLLKKVQVTEAIETETRKALKAADLTEKHVMQGLMREPGLDGQGGSEDGVQGGRIRAMELCGKALPGGMFTERTVTEEAQLTGSELILKLARDDCPHMAAGAVIDLCLDSPQMEKELSKVSPEAGDALREYRKEMPGKNYSYLTAERVEN